MRLKTNIKEEFGLRQFDVAPLIDVVFILIIFFMLTSSFVVQPGIRIELPRVVTAEKLRTERLTIVVSSEDVVYVENKVVTDSQLEQLLNKYKDGKKLTSVFIKADRNSSLGRVTKIWDICRKAGISQVNIATTYGK